MLILQRWKILYFLLFCAVLGDICLLALMLVTAPCFNCLIIASIFAGLFLSLALAVRKKNKIPFLFFIWTLFFLMNVGALIKSTVTPYAIYSDTSISNPQDASMRVYFSPSCTACNELVLSLGNEVATSNNNIAWFPVAEESADIILVRQMQSYINNGDTLEQALIKTKENPTKSTFYSFIPDLLMQCKLLVNQAHLSNAGTSKIPFIEYTGVPAFLNTSKKKNNPLDNLGSMMQNNTETQNPLLFDMSVSGFCDQKSDEPCD